MKKNIFVLTALLLMIIISLSAQDLQKVTYGSKDGMDLVMGVKKPTEPNGASVVMVVSGGFRSSWQQAQNLAELSQPLIDRGYTLFFVVHGSAPRYTAEEAIADVRYAVRWIKHSAKEYGIDPNRMGITGGSSGGQTSLLIATQSDSGIPDATDPVLREPSNVQAAAVFFPLTDFVNWNFNHDAYKLGPSQRRALSPFDFKRINPFTNTLEVVTDKDSIMASARKLSPLYSIDENTPPVFIAHGDSDPVIELSQSTRFIDALRAKGIPCELIVKPGGQHGRWDDMSDYYNKFADWYDKYLK